MESAIEGENISAENLLLAGMGPIIQKVEDIKKI